MILDLFRIALMTTLFLLVLWWPLGLIGKKRGP